MLYISLKWKLFFEMDSSSIGRVVLIGIGAVLIFVFITKVLPKVLALASNLIGMAVSLAIVFIVGLILVRVLKWRLK